MSIRDILQTEKSAGFGIAELLTNAEQRQRGERNPLGIQPVSHVIDGTAALMLPPGAVAEYQFHETRRWRFDYAWPERMVALEIEGGAWTHGRHTRGAGFIADLEKYAEAAIAGWCLIRATPQQLESGEAGALVARAIAARGTE